MRDMTEADLLLEKRTCEVLDTLAFKMSSDVDPLVWGHMMRAVMSESKERLYGGIFSLIMMLAKVLQRTGSASEDFLRTAWLEQNTNLHMNNLALTCAKNSREFVVCFRFWYRWLLATTYCCASPPAGFNHHCIACFLVRHAPVHADCVADTNLAASVNGKLRANPNYWPNRRIRSPK